MVRLTVPEHVLNQYEALAPGKAEELMERRLADTVAWPKTVPLCIHDGERKQLEALLKQNLRDGAQIVKAVSRLSRVKVEKAEVPVAATLNERLRTRCPRNVKFEEFLTGLVQTLLEGYVGMR